MTALRLFPSSMADSLLRIPIFTLLIFMGSLLVPYDIVLKIADESTPREDANYCSSCRYKAFLIRASCSARYSAIRLLSASASARRRAAGSRSRQ